MDNGTSVPPVDRTALIMEQARLEAQKAAERKQTEAEKQARAEAEAYLARVAEKFGFLLAEFQEDLRLARAERDDVEAAADEGRRSETPGES